MKLGLGPVARSTALALSAGLSACSVGLSACTTETTTKTSAPSATEPTPAEPPAPEPEQPDPRLAGRPYVVHVPAGLDENTAVPLVFAFHGYGDGDNGKQLEKFFKLTPVADEQKFLYITPEGTKDKAGEQFWNGTDACCAFDGNPPDDVGYIRAVVDDVAKKHKLDRKRVFAVGLSAGGFFAHRLACDAADVFAAIVSMSGATFEDKQRCAPKDGVAVVELHGEKDDVVKVEGGELYAVKYPSAQNTVAHWAGYNGCTGTLADSGQTLDLFTLPGAETTVARYQGCARGAVELWTVKNGSHAPMMGPSFGKSIWSFFAAHPKG
jgi:polyhydroxybutyrate depolymerase